MVPPKTNGPGFSRSVVLGGYYASPGSNLCCVPVGASSDDAASLTGGGGAVGGSGGVGGLGVRPPVAGTTAS